MSAIERVPNNRIRIDGDLIANTGQLGIHGNITGTITPFNVVPAGSVTQYFSSYFITVTGTAVILQLPPISTAGVNLGWKARFYYVCLPVAGVGGGGSQTLTINNSSATLVYTLNSSVYKGTSASGNTLIPFTVTAIGPGINNWLVEVESATYSQVGFLNNYNASNGGSTLRPFGQLGKFITRSAGTSNINVLFSTPVVITFSTAPIIVASIIFFRDGNLYTSTATRVTFARSGSFLLEVYVTVASAGGGTNANCQFAARLNNITILPGYCIDTTTVLGGTSFNYMYRAYFNANTGDFVEILGGKSATSLGTTTVSSSTFYTINCLGT
jgi:hypothetical protein